MSWSWMGCSAVLVGAAVAGLVSPALADGPSTVKTTLEDFFVPGSQQGDVANIVVSGYNDDFTTCSSCHSSETDPAKPYRRWATSMMGQAARDPIFYACLDIANKDAGQSGDLCIRCHAPRAWLAGRSTPTDGSAFEQPNHEDFLPGDFDGVTCDVCHRMVDPINFDAELLHEGDLSDDDILDLLFLTHGIDAIPNLQSMQDGSYVVDPDVNKRGPYVLAEDHFENNHDWGQSPFHRRGLFCATCHDVSNPVYTRQGGVYVLNAVDTAHPTLNKYDMFPIERTFSEWSKSSFAQHPVNMGGKFDPANPAVATCQDCHMPKVSGKACDTDQATMRDDIGVHNFAGSTRWVLHAIYDTVELVDGEETGRTGMTQASLTQADANVQQMMSWAADMELTQVGDQLRVRIVNNAGHKLTTGYPEGRRMWINVQFYDLQIKDNTLIGEHGHYDLATAELTHDTKIYEAELGVDAAVAEATGVNGGRPGHTFHFVLNNVYLKDNRIPPRGFTHADFEAIQAAPVAKENDPWPSAYADGQFWDDTFFPIPGGLQPSEYVEVTLYHQTTTREYIEFLRDANPNRNDPTNRGQVAYDAWVAQGKSLPTVMVFDTLKLTDPGTPVGTIRYVDDTASGDNDGTSWTDAFVDLQSALAVVQPGDQVWVAVGTYKPTATTDRTISFAIPAGVSVYGGFDGVEADLAARAGRYDETILSGDIGAAGNSSDNSHHVVTVPGGGAADPIVFDGFLVTAGNADDTSNGEGAGMNAGATGFLEIANCLFIGNQADSSGAGVSNSSAGVVTLTDCMFSGNVRHFDAIMVGGGFYNATGAYARLLNCSFTGNDALVGGGAYAAVDSTMVVSNSILWGNTSPGAADLETEQISAGGAAVPVSYTIIEGLSGALGGVGNLGDDPVFLDADGPDDVVGTIDDNLRLGQCSPAIDSGHSNAVPGVLTDLDHLARRLDDPLIPDSGGGAAPIIDRGAYEYNPALFCRTDLVLNNQVDIQDFLRVLADWGPCADPCRPECISDTNCDCVVDIQDFFNVLDTWGPCQ